MVLLDLGMPGLDGFEVAAGIRRQPGGSQVVIVAITGLTGEDAKQHAFAAGFDLYLTKPASLEALADVLDILDPPAPRAAGGSGKRRQPTDPFSNTWN